MNEIETLIFTEILLRETNLNLDLLILHLHVINSEFYSGVILFVIVFIKLRIG